MIVTVIKNSLRKKDVFLDMKLVVGKLYSAWVAQTYQASLKARQAGVEDEPVIQNKQVSLISECSRSHA